MATSASTRSKSSSSSSAATDALALLKQDHREVDEMFKEFDKSDDDDEKGELAEKICKALTVHAQIEEEIFYPASREAVGEDDLDMLDEAEVEHGSLKQLIEDLEGMGPQDDLYDATVTVLGEYVRHHVKEEEGEMFKKVKAAGVDLKELGARMAARKAELMGEETEEE